MNARRRFLQHSSAFLGTLLLTPLLSACEGGDGSSDGGGSSSSGGGTPQPSVQLQLHEEGAPHKATWMAFPGSSAIWGAQLAGVQDAIARVAKAIVDFEPVNVLVNPADLAQAQQKMDPRVTLIPAALDDLWMRDTGPVFAFAPDGSKVGVGFNFNAWGKKPQPYANDATVAATVANKSGARFVTSRLTLEGGGLEWDGQGTAIITESCVLNLNRNPGLSKADCEAELAKIGIRKVIWLPGIAGKDITDGHTDFYARFVRPGVVVAGLENDPAQYDYAVTRKHLDILKAATDAQGTALQVYTLPGPDSVRQPNNKDFAAGYINYYLCNGGLIMPQFGSAASDANAKALMQQLYPGRTVVQLDIDAIAAGGGGIHCTTQQEPR